MRPEAGDLLMGGFGTLLMDIAPNLTASYAAGSATLVGLIMYCASLEYERGAEVRRRENEMFRTIFHDAQSHLDGDLGARVREAAAGADETLTISALNAANDALRRVLIDLHAHVEETDGAWARRTEHEILRALDASARMRAIALPQL